MANGVNKSTLKGYFATGQIPTQPHFEDLVDCSINTAETSQQFLSSSLVTHVVGSSTYGAGVQGTGDVYKHNVLDVNSEKITTIVVDLQGLSASAADNAVIGLSGSDSSYLMQWKTAVNGNLYKIELGCGETLLGGGADVDLAFSASIQSTYATISQSNAVLFTSDSGRDAGDFKTSNSMVGVPSNDDYIHLMNGTSGTDSPYTAGKLIIKFYGI
tara:strand:- start:397 stop:1041 length:645 start_codon:yes stop_codon:yes gene_type:complete